MRGQVREPALSVALWLSWGAALGAVACAMALLNQQTELQTLRREVTRLQRTGGPSEKGEGYPWLSFQKQSPDSLEAQENGERSRRRRAVLTHKQKKKHSVLHLVPINITSKEDSDVTEVMWQPVLKRGRGLEAQGYVVRVWDAGVYLLYSQVLFHDVTFTMGQVVSREGQGRQETLFRCIRSMPSNPDWAYNSCYSAGVFHLHQGDILSVIIPRARAKLSLSPHGTFLGNPQSLPSLRKTPGSLCHTSLQVTSASSPHENELSSFLSIHLTSVSITVSRGVFIIGPSEGGARRRQSPCSHITLRVPSFAFYAVRPPGMASHSKPLFWLRRVAREPWLNRTPLCWSCLTPASSFCSSSA
ncbi:PREDICTED: tumor necrosis factor ligand superfamily member 13 isoform X2 [Hipposideros armiger]|nr:PREDICTED: tumor necrosis factor ligand superfamily member 13 isoform X2 [Hipposideros armiger]